MFSRILFSLFLLSVPLVSAQETMIYSGSYSADLDWVKGTPGGGVVAHRLDANGQFLSSINYTDAGVNPTFLEFSSDNKFLYACNDAGDITSFSITESGALTKLNAEKTSSNSAVHIALSEDDSYIFTAHYSGYVSVNKLEANGMVGSLVASQKLEGFSNVNTGRQEAPHAHQVYLKDGKYLFVPDLGADKVYQMEWDAATENLSYNSAAPAYATKPGSGPRHMIFHPKLPVAYLVNELLNVLDVLAYDANAGTLSRTAETTTLSKPAAPGMEQKGAAIYFDSTGEYLYVSNRGGENSVVQFEVNAQDGSVELVQGFETEGQQPRDFTLLDDNTIVAANQDSDSIVILKKNADGKFALEGEISTGSPTRVLTLSV